MNGMLMDRDNISLVVYSTFHNGSVLSADLSETILFVQLVTQKICTVQGLWAEKKVRYWLNKETRLLVEVTFYLALSLCHYLPAHFYTHSFHISHLGIIKALNGDFF